jgi:putative addiction module component (TIGR02574 family)
MTKDAERLFHEALDLPESERAELAAQLLATLDGPADEDVDEAWAAEVERRCADLDAGRVATMDWEAVRKRIEKDIFGR